MLRKLMMFLILATPMLRGQYIYVANQGSNSISAYKIGAFNLLTLVGTYAVGAPGGPSGVAVDPINRFVVVASPAAGNVTSYTINPDGSLSFASSFGVFRTAPQFIATDGTFVYVAGADILHPSQASISVLDILPNGTMHRIGEWSVAGIDFFNGAAITAMALDPKDRFLEVGGYVTVDGAQYSAALWKFNILQGGTLQAGPTSIVGTDAVGADEITALAIDPAGRFLYAEIANTVLFSCCAAEILVIPANYAGDLSEVQSRTQEFVFTGVMFGIDFAPQVMAMSPKGDQLFVPGNQALAALTIGPDGTLSYQGSVPLPGLSDTAGIDPTGAMLFVLDCPQCSTAGMVQPFNISTTGLTAEATRSTGVHPVSIATTTCTAPLPGQSSLDLNINTSGFTYPFTIVAPVGTSSGTRTLTFTGSVLSVIQTKNYAPTCPATTYNAGFFAGATSSVGNLIGLAFAKGTTQLGGGFTVPLTLRLTPPNPIVPPSPITVQSFVTVNSKGAPTSVSTPPTGLVSWWQAEGNSADATGNNPGTLSGVLFTPGRVGQAFDFSFVSDILPVNDVQVASSPSLKPQNVTVMAWVKNSGHPGFDQYILSQGAKGCFAASYALYSGSNNLSFYISDGGNFYESPDAGQTVWDGNWHFVAGSYNGSSVRLYVDGVEAGTGTPVATTINYANMDNDNFYIGAYRGSCDLGFPGSVDEVRVFNRALTAPEIQSVYQATQ